MSLAARDRPRANVDMPSQSYGPLFPFSEYLLLNSVFISSGAYAAIAVVLIIFLFPETMNHAFLTATSEIFGKLKKVIEIQELLLSAQPMDLDAESPLIRKVIGARLEIVMLFSKCSSYSLNLVWCSYADYMRL